MTAGVLQRPTLVLNRSWQPVNVATVARALALLWNSSARVVDPSTYQLYEWSDWSRLQPDDDQPFIRSVSSRLRVPEVIVLMTYDRMPQGTVALSRRNIFRRDQYTCQYCGRKPGSEELTIDHIDPRSRGGETTWLNCVLACVSCNTHKRDRTPKEAGMHLIRKPKKPHWLPIYAKMVPLRIESWSKFISEAYWNVELDGSPDQ